MRIKEGCYLYIAAHQHSCASREGRKKIIKAKEKDEETGERDIYKGVVGVSITFGCTNTFSRN